MPLAVILNNSPLHSYKVFGGYIRQSLEEQGVTVTEHELPTSADGREKMRAQYPDAVFFHNTAPVEPTAAPNADATALQWHHLSLRSDVIPGVKNILLPSVQFSRISAPLAALYHRYDEIWTSTRHVGEVLQKSGVSKPILRLPPALDRDAVPPKTNYDAGAPFRFLFVGEATPRKGIHFLIAGFLKAFPVEGMAQLTIKTSSSQNWLSPREDIQILSDLRTRQDFLELYRQHDAYISASTAEALGLPIAEAILAGLPVCANFWGGHRDVLTSGGYFPLAFVEEHAPFDGPPQLFTPGQYCAISDEDAVARALLKIVNSSPRDRQKKAEKARHEFLKSYGSAALKPYWAAQVQRLFNNSAVTL